MGGVVSEKRALVLKRVSSDGQKDNYSPESQESACLEYVRGVGYTVCGMLMEVCSGAFEFDERPVMREVLEAIRARTCDAVVIHRVNRATRAGGIHALMLAHECERNAVELHFVDGVVKGKVDITTTAGKIMLLIAGDQAHEERNSLNEAMGRGLRTRVQSHGRPLAGRRVRYGYIWVDEKDPTTGKVIPKARAIVNELEVPIIRRIYTDAANGKPVRTIARELMRDHVPSPDGGPNWSHGVVRAILRDSRYMGVAYAYRLTKRRIDHEHYKQTERPESERVQLPEGTFPAIVDADTWHKVQAMLDGNQQLATRNNSNPESALLRGGYVQCAGCGCHMFVKNLPNNNAKYWCASTPWTKDKCQHPTIATGILDGEVWSWLKIILDDPEVLVRDLRRRYRDDLSGLKSDLEAYQKILEHIQDRERALIRMGSNAADETQLAEIQAQLATVAPQRQKAQQAVREAEYRLANQERVQAGFLDTAAFLYDLARDVDAATYEGKRRAVRTLVKRVLIWPASHVPRYQLELQVPSFLSLRVQGIAGDGTIVDSTTPRCIRGSIRWATASG